MKRLFFALETHAPWPDKFPPGRLLDEEARHLTLAFLGMVDAEKLQACIPQMPLPEFSIGLTGFFDECLFLPPQTPRVAAWNANFIGERKPLDAYQGTLCRWLQTQGFPPHLHKEFLAHVTLCRAPFPYKEWRRSFSPLPFLTGNLQLYESLGSSKYKALWTHPILPAFEEIHHTADLAFIIRGENLNHLFQNAKIALSFQFPPLLSFFSEDSKVQNIDDIIIELNRLIGRADQEMGCPFKAVSYHGDVIQNDRNQLSWEMIVDV